MRLSPEEVATWLDRSVVSLTEDARKWGGTPEMNYREMHPALRDLRTLPGGRLGDDTFELVRLLGERMGVSRAEQLQLEQSHFTILLDPPPGPNDDEERTFARIMDVLRSVP